LNVKVLKRRVEILEAISTGLNPSSVITQLGEKYDVTERALWSDWERREKWVPLLLSIERYAGFAEMVEQKLGAVQKAAWNVTWERSSPHSYFWISRFFINYFQDAISCIAFLVSSSRPYSR